MYEIIKAYDQQVPAARFIGLKYGEEDSVNGGFGAHWADWFEKERFQKLEELTTEDFKNTYEDSFSYAGLIRCGYGGPLQYWIGMFLPDDTYVPEGYDYVDFPAARLGVSWIYGPEEEIFQNEDKCLDRLRNEGYEIAEGKELEGWFFERYVCPRFTTKDEKGNVILDICQFIK